MKPNIFKYTIINPILYTIIVLILLTGIEGMTNYCGLERWDIKQCRDIKASNIDTNKIFISTVYDECSIKRPFLKLNERQPAEYQIVKLNCLITGYGVESDMDIHIVLKDLNYNITMIAEIPSIKCTELRESRFYNKINSAGNQFIHIFGYPLTHFVTLKQPVPVSITGVRFFDFPHFQKGCAPNAVELHPVLDLKR